MAIAFQHERGFAIGNGLSRQGFDLESLYGRGPTVGCNWLYQDFSPDVIVVLDSAPLDRIAKIQGRRFGLITRCKCRHCIVLDDKPILPYDVNGWYSANSGLVACAYLARVERVQTVVMIGFDFFRPVQNEKRENDIYGGWHTNHKDMALGFADFIAGCKVELGTRFVRVGKIEELDREYFESIQGLELRETNQI